MMKKSMQSNTETNQIKNATGSPDQSTDRSESISEMRRFKIFLASPGNVTDERKLARDVIFLGGKANDRGHHRWCGFP